MSTPIVKKTYNVGGLLVHIYSKPDLLSNSGASKEIAALFLLHGRTGSADDPYIGETAQTAFDWAEQHPGQQRDFIVIAFVSSPYFPRTRAHLPGHHQLSGLYLC